MTDHLLWLDLETTGTDETKDSIIEIGVIPTTTDLEVLGEWVEVVRPTDEAFGRLMRNDVVFRMHVANGLFEEIREPDVPTIGAVEHQLLKWLDDVHPQAEHQWVLAGSGVGHFDRRFIKAQMPRLDRRLRHWSIDVGVLRRAFLLWGPPQEAELYVAGAPTKPHRALDDAYQHLAEARAWQTELAGMAAPITIP